MAAAAAAAAATTTGTAHGDIVHAAAAAAAASDHPAQTYAMALATAVESSRETRMDDMDRQIVHMRRGMDDLQAQLVTERSLRSHLEARVNLLVSALPVPPALAAHFMSPSAMPNHLGGARINDVDADRAAEMRMGVQRSA